MANEDGHHSAVSASALRAGANRVSNCAAYSLGSHSWVRGSSDCSDAAPAGLLAYGASNFVAVYHPGSAAILALLSGHTGRVNGVDWVHRSSAAPQHSSPAIFGDEDALISASSDGTLRVWHLGDLATRSSALASTGSLAWRCSAVLAGHSASVTAVSCCTLPSGSQVAVSSSVDGTLRAWGSSGSSSSSEEEGWAAAPGGLHRLKSGCIMETVATSPLPWSSNDSNSALVAAGGVDSRIHLFQVNSGSGGPSTPVFVELLVLRGHLDWIRCLAFSFHGVLAAGGMGGLGSALGTLSGATAAAPVSLYLASASQDRKVRVWRVKLLHASAAVGSASSAAADSSNSAEPSTTCKNDDDDEDDNDDDEGRDAAAAAATANPASSSAADDLIGASLESALQRPSTFSFRDSNGGAAAASPTTPSPLLPVAHRLLSCQVEFDALLSGHDGWINTVRWHPPVRVAVGSTDVRMGVGRVGSSASAAAYQPHIDAKCSDGVEQERRAWRWWQPPALISCGMDKLVIMWQPSGTANSFYDLGIGSTTVTGAASSAAVSESTPAAATATIAGLAPTLLDAAPSAPSTTSAAAPSSSSPTSPTALAAAAAASSAEEAALWAGTWEPVCRLGGGDGGSALGLYGACVSPDGSTVVAHGYQGALHAWVGELPPRHASQAPAETVVEPHGVAVGGGDGAVLVSPAHFAAAACQALVWKAVTSPSGHFGPVNSVAWGTRGGYFLSFSADATTRAWAPATWSWKPRGEVVSRPDADGRTPLLLPSLPSSSSSSSTSWYEVGRPQIHGYEMVCGSVPPLRGTPHRLFSAGDEKVVRVFDAPKQFLRTLVGVCGSPLAAWLTATEGGVGGLTTMAGEGDAGRAEYAYVPELALTNKGVESSRGSAAVAGPASPLSSTNAPPPSGSSIDDGSGEGGTAAPQLMGTGGPADGSDGYGRSSSSGSVPPVSSAASPPGLQWGGSASHPSCPPPLEADLVRHTRWPEVDKLFAHTSEIVAMAVSSDGRLVATAGTARDEGTAVVRVWDAATMRLHQTLPPAHKLTVVALAFSRDPRASCVAGVGEGVWAECTAEEEGRDGDTPSPSSHPERQYLVTTSKDRAVAIYGSPSTATPSPPPMFSLLTVVPGAHKRIIWSIDWAPSPPSPPPSACPSPSANADTAAVAAHSRGAHVGEVQAGESTVSAVLTFVLPPPPRVFATGARDQMVKLWTVVPALTPPAVVPSTTTSSSGADGVAEGGGGVCLTAFAPLPAFTSAVTALAFTPIVSGRRARATPDAASSSTTSSSSAAATSTTSAPAAAVYRWWLAVGQESGAMSLWGVTLSVPATSTSSISSLHAASPAMPAAVPHHHPLLSGAAVSAASATSPSLPSWTAFQVAVWDPRIAHTSTVRGIAWRPLLRSPTGPLLLPSVWRAASPLGGDGRGEGEEGLKLRPHGGTTTAVGLEVATCSEDGTVRVFSVALEC